MDKEFYGDRTAQFGNSWLFSPIVWDVLLDKYLPQRSIQMFDGKRAGFMITVMTDKSLPSDLNDCINNCENISDRVAWEMSNQQIFFTKDKTTIADAIRKFVHDNKKYNCNSEGLYPLEQENIINRFNEIADSITEVDETKVPYFIFKNTSVDDNVEYWFSNFDEESGEYVSSSLKVIDKPVAEFVSITESGMKFTDSLSYIRQHN